MRRYCISDEIVNQHHELMPLHGYNNTHVCRLLGISARSGRRIKNGHHRPGRKQGEARKSTRKDPLNGLFELEVVPQLERNPDLTAAYLFGQFRQRHPEYGESVEKTFERRTAAWRLLNGKEKEKSFPQSHPPGLEAQADFTDMRSVGVTVGGRSFPHLLFNVRLNNSGCLHSEVVNGGESFQALTGGLANAFQRFGGVPRRIRTDSLSAAYGNRKADVKKDLNRRFMAFCRHYGVEPVRINPGRSNENGGIESTHGHFRNYVENGLKDRGSRDFATIGDYERFIAELLEPWNRRRDVEIEREREFLQKLPPEPHSEYEEADVKVNKFGLFRLRGVTYNVPTRLIGQRLKACLHQDRVELFKYGESLAELPRGGSEDEGGTGWVIDYRYDLHSLERKPGAMLRLKYLDHLFPAPVWREVFDLARERIGDRPACRLLVGLLGLAVEFDGEAALTETMTRQLAAGRLPSVDTMRSHFQDGTRFTAGGKGGYPAALPTGNFAPPCHSPANDNAVTGGGADTATPVPRHWNPDGVDRPAPLQPN